MWVGAIHLFVIVIVLFANSPKMDNVNDNKTNNIPIVMRVIELSTVFIKFKTVITIILFLGIIYTQSRITHMLGSSH